MHLNISRLTTYSDAIDGKVTINGEYVCDSSECKTKAILPGDYRIVLHKCKQYGRRMPLIIPEDANKKKCGSRCSRCRQLKNVSNNTLMPCPCPMLKPGNGVANRTDGSIIVGQNAAYGLLLHPDESFKRIFDRMRKCGGRHEEITLTILG